MFRLDLSRFAFALAVVVVLLTAAAACDPTLKNRLRRAPDSTAAPHRPEEAPLRLEDTGLYADPAAFALAEGVATFTPQYPLWSDGAKKRRFLLLPPNESIDASDPDSWSFPVGTKFWKEFAFERKVETRYMERKADGGWIFATYLWSEDGKTTKRAPATGAKRAHVAEDGVPFDVPSFGDCVACHGTGSNPVLGFGALQLSPDRDPLAPHAEPARPTDVDLPRAAASGLVRGLPEALLRTPPRIHATTPRERAVLGYLHGNCASCHRAGGSIDALRLRFDRPAAPGLDVEGSSLAASGLLDVPSVFRVEGAHARLKGGAPRESVLWRRMATRDPCVRMPPFASNRVDDEALELVGAWIANDVPESPPRAPSRGGRD
jgi:mono/diheme cytochrome c family protein